MIKKWLVIGIILLFVGVTMAPTINFNTVKASQQNVINERINQRELLFQTIVDIANNKEIQRIILKSQMSRGIFPTTEFPVITKNQLRQMYFLGLILSKVISKSRIQSMVQKYQFNNQEIQKEISAVIEKDVTLKEEILQLQDPKCDCENKSASEWRFPVICVVLMILFFSIYLLLFLINVLLGAVPNALMFLLLELSYIPWYLGYTLGCRFAGYGPGTR